MHALPLSAGVLSIDKVNMIEVRLVAQILNLFGIAGLLKLKEMLCVLLPSLLPDTFLRQHLLLHRQTGAWFGQL